MSNKSSQGNSLGPGSRTRRKMSGERLQALSKNKCKELIQDMLISTGKRELMKRLVQSRLAQSGWTYSMRSKYIDYIKQKGADNVNVSHMISETVSKGVENFPETVKTEIAELLWDFTSEFITVDDTALSPSESDNGYTHSDTFQYQTKEAKADPGLGVNVATPELCLSRSPSPVSIPRPLTPQPPIPILRAESIKNEIKEEPICEDEDDLSSEVEENEEDEDEDGADDDSNRTLNEESEEELMDV